MRQAEEIFLNDAPVAPIYQKGGASLRNPQLKGIEYHQIGGDYSLKHAYMDKSIDRETGKKNSNNKIKVLGINRCLRLCGFYNLSKNLKSIFF